MWREAGFTLKQTSKTERGEGGQTMTSSLWQSACVALKAALMASAEPFFLLKVYHVFLQRQIRWTTCTLAYIRDDHTVHAIHPSIWQTTVTVAIDTVKLSSACVAIVCSWYMVRRGHGYNHNTTDFECEVKDSQKSITYIYIDIIILTNYLFYFGHWEERKETF